MDIERWLRGLGMERYAESFRRSDIRGDVLPKLTEAELRELGVSLGDRIRLLSAIAGLNRAAVDQPPQSLPSDASLGPGDPRRTLAPERRQLTVMFIDLVGSTPLASRLDPEEMREIFRAFQSTVADEVARFEGHIAKFLGDGALAYFGWPQAHEDDAERAVRAGLGLVEAVGRLAAPDGSHLAVRVGIATGLVVVGDVIGAGSAREEGVAGAVPHLAARLQAFAAPSSVLVGETTRHLLGETFNLDDIGPQQLKGIGTPVRAFLVRSERPAVSRFQARTVAFGPLVGRDHELGLLLDHWHEAERGEGRALLLVGEAGIGKSRLVQALIDAIGEAQFACLRFQCSPHHTGSALWPLKQQLGFAARFGADDDGEAQFGKLQTLLRESGSDSPDSAALLAALLGIEAGTSHRVQLTPEQQRNRALALLVQHILGLAKARPVLALFEDAHWLDPTTLELIEQVLAAIPPSRVLLVLTSRPDGQPKLGHHPHLTTLAIGRLNRRAAAAIVARLAEGRMLPDAVAAEILARTERIPLFIEELTKAVLESPALDRTQASSASLPGEAVPIIPSTLQDSLMARLDRLGWAKNTAQTASCIGREVDYQLLAAIYEQPESQLRDALDRLVESELMFCRGAPPNATYSFKHALIRDAAYESLLRVTRQHVHARIAAALQARFPEVVNNEPQIVAHHCTAAGLIEPAVEFWRKAGEAAMARPAYEEAIEHFSRAIALVGRIANKDERREGEIGLLLRLGQASIANRGYGDERTAEIFSRARALAAAAPTSPLSLPAYYGTWTAHFSRVELGAALACAREMEQAAAGQSDRGAATLAQRMLASTLAVMGDFQKARLGFEQALAGHHAERDGDVVDRFGQDSAVTIRGMLAVTMWCIGSPEQAERTAEYAMRQAGVTRHPVMTAYALFHAGLVAVLMRSPKAADLARAGLQHATERHLRMWEGLSLGLTGCARTQDLAAAITAMEHAVAILDGADARLFTPFFLTVQADTLMRLGRTQDAAAALDEAERRIRMSSERWSWPETLRVRGELYRAGGAGSRADAELAYEQALIAARAQGALGWELRSALSLAALWRDQGKLAEARDLVRPARARFAAGIATPELAEADDMLAG